MKKLFVIVLVLSMLLGASAVATDDLAVQMIGGEDAAPQTLSLDDMKPGQTYTIDGYAKVAPKQFLIVNHFAQFNNAEYQEYDNAMRNIKNQNSVFYQERGLKGEQGWCYTQAAWMDSGTNAEFAWLQIDVTNLKKSGVKYMEEAAVKVVYADEYEFEGWVRQINFDYTGMVYRYGADTQTAPYCVMNPDQEEEIGMMYTGTYIFGCTLPNSVIQDKSPLRMEINLGGNELTYHIRK